ncbi:MAG: aspartate-semialdehyde dehydrogenase [Pseudomonadota bacterium]
MSKKEFNIAVVGATGAVGETMLEVLAERNFPVARLEALASERSAGKRVRFGQKSIVVKDLATFDFTGIDIALFSAGGSVSAEYAPKAAAAGAVVIDNTSHFRRQDDIPLVIPEVNPEAIAGYKNHGIIANPNCSTIQMLVALKPIHDAVGITRINVCTYQAVSGTGQSAMEELASQTANLLNGTEAECSVYPHRIAFNVLPQIDAFQENGYTREEMKMVWETQKILGDNSIQVNPTCVRVPVFIGHSEAVHIELKKKLSAEDARALLEASASIKVLDERKNGGYPTPALNAAGQDATWVGRIREDISHPTGLNMWIVADNVRKGAATNSIQIAEHLINHYL